jgi:hypothetical protein
MNKKKEYTEEQTTESFKRSFYRKFGYTPLIILERPSSKRPSLIMPLDELEQHFNIFIDKNIACKGYKLRSRHRYRELVDYRFMFAHIARSMEYKLTTIGKYLKKHHSSIIHYENAFENMMETSECFKEKYNEIFNYIKTKIKKDDKLPAVVNTDEARCES